MSKSNSMISIVAQTGGNYGRSILPIAIAGVVAYGLVTIQRRRKVPMLKMDPESEYHFHVNKELSDETIVSLNSRKRNTVKWLPTKGHIRGVVVIAHGLHEHSLRYSDLAHALTTKGFAVFAIDHEGHGHSGDVHGLVSDWRHLSEDFVSFTEAVHAQFPTLPIMMFGHSMGTSIVIQSAEHLNYIKAAVLCGTSFVPGPGSLCPWGYDFLYPYRAQIIPLLAVLSRFLPKAPASYLSYEEMVKDEDALMHLHHDPRRFHGYIMNKTAIEVIMMIKKTREETVKNFDVPFLALHGADDKVCLPAGAQMLLDKSATRKDRKRLEMLPGMKHEFLHEGKVDGPKNIEKVVQYFEEQLKILEQSDAPVPVPVPIK